MKLNMLRETLDSMKILDHPIYGYELRTDTDEWSALKPKSHLVEEFNLLLDSIKKGEMEYSLEDLEQLRQRAVEDEKAFHYIHPVPIVGHRVRNKEDFYGCLEEGKILSRNDLEKEKPEHENFFTYEFDKILRLSEMVFFGVGAGFFDKEGECSRL